MGTIANDDEVLLELGLADTATPEQRAVVVSATSYAEGAVRRYLKYDPVRRNRTEYYPQMDLDFSNQGAGVWESEGNQAILRRRSQAAASELQIRHLPIRSVSSLRVDHDARSGTNPFAFAAATEKTEGTDFWPNYDALDSDGSQICRDGILRSMGAWPTNPGTVRITYTAGYTDEEFRGSEIVVDAVPIWEAVVAEAVRKAKSVFVNMMSARGGWAAGPRTTERLGDYGYSIDAALAARLFGGSWDLMPESKEKLSEYRNFGIGMVS